MAENLRTASTVSSSHVEFDRRLQILMPENPADEFVIGRVFFQDECCGEVAELMRRHADAEPLSDPLDDLIRSASPWSCARRPHLERAKDYLGGTGEGGTR